ncbi:MAG: AAA family ATPase [Hornefia butyriciproducens]|uniref:AAA family ATPase n=1 Tax=Hornefia butyriciproducens TaxID=2652293 RepID=UPI002A76112D|nr:AAA family ATPase [Hornefia butyriciproducens]MDY2990633.1 AAA family ATPase [Hornefia butyriciproducens]
MYFTKDTVQRAVRDMRGAADHMLKIWFVLKAMGLTRTQNVLIDTSNSTPYLSKLFKSGNADGSFFVPFAHTERFAKMKSDAARSIIQTNIQRWASSGSVVTVDPTSFMEFSNTSEGLTARVGRQYPLGLGIDKSGFAREDGQRVNIPILQFAVWLFSQTDIDDTRETSIIERMKSELNLEPSECDLIFTQKPFTLNFQSTPISDKDLSDICNSAFDEPITLEAQLETKTDYVKRVKNMITLSEKPAWITSAPEAQLQALISQGEKAILLYGPPRTGKTRAIDNIFGRDSSDRCTIQLHEGWGYENLIIGLFPQPDGSFKWLDGALLRAINDGKKIIVLEEVNRTHLSQALGEVFSLIESAYRGEKNAIELPNGQSFYIPEDVTFFFTMNNIDTSTEDIDDALVGRMASIFFPPRIEDLNEMLSSIGIDEISKENIKTVFNVIQQSYPLGHGYFARMTNSTNFIQYYVSRIRPVLSNHFDAFEPEILSQIDNTVDSLFNTGN